MTAQGHIVHDTVPALEKGLRLSLWPHIPVFVNVPWKLFIINACNYRCV